MIAIDRSPIQVGDADFARSNFAGSFANIPVPNVGDAMDRMGMYDAGLRAMWPRARCVGTAFPVTACAGGSAGLAYAAAMARQI